MPTPLVSKRTKFAGGTLEVCVAPGIDVEVALASARELHERSAATSGREVLGDGTDAWIKAAELSASGARRHGRARLFGRTAPHVRELRHLVWLRERLFRAPRPLFAATLVRGARLTFQALATVPVVHEGHLLNQATEAASGTRHANAPESLELAVELAVELGRELGRLHALGFLHADLYPRNVLVADPEDGVEGGRRLVFLDCWAGGPGHGDRSPIRPLARDLGTWFATAASAWTIAQQSTFFEAYSTTRHANGRPLRSIGRFLTQVVRERRRELRRLERDPRRLRGAPFPLVGWEPAQFASACTKRPGAGSTPSTTR